MEFLLNVKKKPFQTYRCATQHLAQPKARYCNDRVAKKILTPHHRFNKYLRPLTTALASGRG
eukprot:6459352-Amphidinium_carterae.1